MSPEDSTTVRVAVHDATLAKTALLEEPFLKQGQGSAFVSRPHELVVVSVTETGLPALQQKVVQLVERGFHYIIVSLRDVEKLERDSLKLILKTRSYVENWAGFLWLCDVCPEVLGIMRLMGVEQDFDPASSRAVAIERFQKEATLSAPTDAVQAVKRAEVAEPPRGNTSSADEIRLDWDGPETAPAKKAEPTKAAEPERAPVPDVDPSTLPEVDVAELVVHADELAKLDRQVDGVIARGKKYVTMRLHFKKRMKTEDVTILTQVRDQLKRAGGQLALASLQQDVATWLRLLDYDREFLIFDDVDGAEVAHRRHAAGLQPKAGGERSAAPAAEKQDLRISAKTPTSVTVKAAAPPAGAPARAQAALTLVRVARAALDLLPAEAVRLSASGAKNVVVDLKTLDAGQRERMEPLVEAVLLAEKQGARLNFANVSREVRAFLKVLGLEKPLALFDDEDQAFLDHAKKILEARPAGELELTVVRMDLGGAAAQTPQPVPRALAELPRDKPLKAARDGKADGQEVERLKAEVARLEAALKDSKTHAPSAEIDMGDVSFVPPSHEEHEKLVNEVARLEEEAQKAKDERERLEARLREADYARNEAVSISRSSDEARKRFQQKIDELEQASKNAEADKKKAASRVAELESIAGSLDGELRKAEEERAKLQARVAELERAASGHGAGSAPAEGGSRVRELEEERAKLQAHAAEQDARIAHLEHELAEEIEKVHPALEAKVAELEAREQKSKSERAALDSQVAEVLAEAKRLKTQVANKVERDTREQTRAFEARLTDVHRERAELEEKLSKVGQEHEGRLAEVQRQRAELEEKLSETRRDHGEQAKAHAAAIQELERKLAAAMADVADDASEARLAEKGDTGGLVARVRQLEREKAAILLESKGEIERLTREQGALREELESAGEMIERLGKELELT